MPDARVLLGVIGRPHGVRGLVRVTSYADPPEAIASYGPLSDDAGRRFTLRWIAEGVAELAEIKDGIATKVSNRSAAETLTNRRLYVPRDNLPAVAEDEFYLADLIGLLAVDEAGREVGTVISVHDYGAGASLEISDSGSPLLIVPFTRASVPTVDIAAGRLTISPPAILDPPKSPLPATPSRERRGSRTSPPLPPREGVRGRGSNETGHGKRP